MNQSGCPGQCTDAPLCCSPVARSKILLFVFRLLDSSTTISPSCETCRTFKSPDSFWFEFLHATHVKPASKCSVRIRSSSALLCLDSKLWNCFQRGPRTPRPPGLRTRQATIAGYIYSLLTVVNCICTGQVARPANLSNASAFRQAVV